MAVFYRVSEAAKRIGCDEKTVRNYIYRGIIKANRTKWYTRIGSSYVEKLRKILSE